MNRAVNLNLGKHGAKARVSTLCDAGPSSDNKTSWLSSMNAVITPSPVTLPPSGHVIADNTRCKLLSMFRVYIYFAQPRPQGPRELLTRKALGTRLYFATKPCSSMTAAVQV